MREKMLPCTFCKAEPKHRYWLQSRIKYEVFGSTGEYRVCPDCHKKIGIAPCSAYALMNEAFTRVRNELAERIARAP